MIHIWRNIVHSGLKEEDDEDHLAQGEVGEGQDPLVLDLAGVVQVLQDLVEDRRDRVVEDARESFCLLVFGDYAWLVERICCVEDLC